MQNKKIKNILVTLEVSKLSTFKEDKEEQSRNIVLKSFAFAVLKLSKFKVVRLLQYRNKPYMLTVLEVSHLLKFREVSDSHSSNI